VLSATTLLKNKTAGGISGFGKHSFYVKSLKKEAVDQVISSIMM